MNRIGILAYGSLIKDPGVELEAFIAERISTITPFGVEYVRLSQKRGNASTVAPHPSGKKAPAKILILRSEVSLKEAGDLLWRRETDRKGTPKTNRAGMSPNSVLIKDWPGLEEIQHVLYSDFPPEGKIPDPNPVDLAKAAIASVARASSGEDGISYLIQLIESGVETFLTPEYTKEILRLTQAPTLQEALAKVRSKADQGQDAEQAAIFFVGSDANFPADYKDKDYDDYKSHFESWIDRRYDQDRTKDEKDETRFYHHPFLLNKPGTPGRKYHETLREIFMGTIKKTQKPRGQQELEWVALVKQVCLLEMSSESTTDGDKKLSDKVILRNTGHLEYLERCLNPSRDRNIVVFIHFGACSLMLKLGEKGIFEKTLKRLDSLWTKQPEGRFPIGHLSNGITNWEKRRIEDVLFNYLSKRRGASGA